MRVRHSNLRVTKPRRTSHKKLAEAYGQQVRNGLAYPKWFGRSGGSPKLIAMLPDDFAELAIRAAHHAKLHRQRYPRRVWR